MIKLKLEQEKKKKNEKEIGVKPIDETLVNPKSNGEIYLIKEMP